MDITMRARIIYALAEKANRYPRGSTERQILADVGSAFADPPELSYDELGDILKEIERNANDQRRNRSSPGDSETE